MDNDRDAVRDRLARINDYLEEAIRRSRTVRERSRQLREENSALRARNLDQHRRPQPAAMNAKLPSAT